MSYDGYKRGRVVLQFRLNYNGTISDVKVVDENVGLALSLMCQKAITDPSPFDKWPRGVPLARLEERPWRRWAVAPGW